MKIFGEKKKTGPLSSQGDVNKKVILENKWSRKKQKCVCVYICAESKSKHEKINHTNPDYETLYPKTSLNF